MLVAIDFINKYFLQIKIDYSCTDEQVGYCVGEIQINKILLFWILLVHYIYIMVSDDSTKKCQRCVFVAKLGWRTLLYTRTLTCAMHGSNQRIK